MTVTVNDETIEVNEKKCIHIPPGMLCVATATITFGWS